MEEYDGSIYSGVFEVNCGSSGKILCHELTIPGTPTIRHGNASDGKQALKDYTPGPQVQHDGHDYDALKRFAELHLGPPCTPTSLNGCRKEEQALFEEVQRQPLEQLEARIKELKATFREKEKQLKRRCRKFDERQDVFDRELKEFKSEKSLYTKAAKQIEDKVSEKQRLKHEAKTKMMQDKSEALEQRRISLLQDRDDISKERWALDAEIRSSGLRIIKLIRDSRASDGSEL
mmetsp:Transcript_128037/g.410275  ORF Transcript_128037/g.410275 Transcript_128037/m.410275 type:complete len:233 (-) Transcript_128037:76-774(-)